MDGIFIKRRFTVVTNTAGLISGLFLALLFGWFLISGEFDTLDDRLCAGFFACFGIFITLLCGVSMAVNRKVYIHVDEKKISAFCHFGLRLECSVSDVRSVSYAYGALNIQLFSGKRYNLMNLANAYDLGRYIEQRIPGAPGEVLSREQLMAKIPPLRAKCRREGIQAMVGFPLLIPLVILTSGLTGWRELHQFSARDWTVFGILGAACLALVAATCVSLRRYLLHNERLHRMEGDLHQQLLRTAPLLPGNALGLYLDHDGHVSVRLTVFGFPNEESVYFAVEQVTRDFQLERIHQSGIYANIRELEPELADMTPIPLPGKSQTA